MTEKSTLAMHGAPTGEATEANDHAAISRSLEIADTPILARPNVSKALAGTASPRQAIKARCMQCSNFQRDEVAACTVVRCALWRYRPFQVRSLPRAR